MAFLGTLPNLPGVYRMLNARGEALYVGKARDLKKRVSSYFQKTGQSPRIAMMLTQVASMEVSVTRSEMEALILENNLIKSLAPRYNILFRDDKSYPYLMVSGDEFPRLDFHRGATDRANRYFGPYPNAGAVRESIQLLQRVFRLRTCEDSVFQNRSRPCLLHQIQRCSGPCVKLIDAERYAEDVKSAILFLEGKSSAVLARMEKAMQAASNTLQFEQAAVYRDQIRSLSGMTQKQYADTGSDSDVDVMGYVFEGGIGCLNLVMIRSGRILGDRSFFPQVFQNDEPADIISAFVEQHYLERPPPRTVVCAVEFAAPSSGGAGPDAAESGVDIAALLSERAGHTVHVVARPIGERRAWLDMAEENARQAIKGRLAEQATNETRLASFREALGLPDTVQRIECFDISHTQGESTVASCVVYDRYDLRRNEYRRFNIEGITPGDDFAAMRQVLMRRYGKVAAGEGVVPDVILIDGGKGQLHIAEEVLADVNLSGVQLIGVAKGPERKPGLEELWVAGRERPVDLAPDTPGLHLIQQIRDEAHRFAITGHRARRGKARLTSTLEDIPGVGGKRRRQLLARFGGLKGVMGASVQDLAQVEGISAKLAERIYRELHAG
ncbi:MAG TPA: excinuclease ABC subunit UvrC [Burkholderiales bacterium]|nr:excinuclease ABC subunit UvrC [Burkholderiales bacterium]